MSFAFWAWSALFFYVIEILLGKILARHLVKNPWLFNFVWSLFILMLLVPPALMANVRVPGQWTDLLIASFFYALCSILYIFCLFRLDVSVLSPLFNVRTALSVFLGALLLAEWLTPRQYALIGVIIVAGFVVSIDEKFNLRSLFSRRMILAFALMVDLALMGIYVNRAVAAVGFWEATLWMAIIAQFMYLVTAPYFIDDLKRISRKQIGALLIMALAGTLGTVAVNKAYAINVSLTSVIISIPLSPVVAFLCSTRWPELLEYHPKRVYVIRLTVTAVMVLAAIAL